MGKLLLVTRLAAKDLRHNRAEAVLLLVAIAATASTLTVGLALHGVASQPYAATRAATNGPDVVAAVVMNGPGGPPSQLTALGHVRGVTGHSGPYLLAFPTTLEVDGNTDPVMAEGRAATAAKIDSRSSSRVDGCATVVWSSSAAWPIFSISRWASGWVSEAMAPTDPVGDQAPCVDSR